MRTSFKRLCVLRVLLLVATLFLMAYLSLAHQMIVTPLGLAGLAVLQTLGLIRLAETSNRELSRFLDAIEVSDFSQRFSPQYKHSLFPELATSFRRVFERFGEMKMETEESSRYLHAVVRNLGVGILAFTPKGEVRLANHAVLKLLNLAKLQRLNELAAVCPELRTKLESIEPSPGEVFRVTVHSEMMELSIRATSLRLRREELVLVSLQNISVELNEKEMEAWQTLIRVLTHEIKNSLTPIASLASSVEQLLPLDELKNDDEFSSDAEDIHNALRTIRKRSEGLQSFVDSYRELTHVPSPDYMTFQIAEIVTRVTTLMAPRIEERGISWTHEVDPEELTIQADPRLIEQVLINLVLNAIEAVRTTGEPEIVIRASTDSRGRALVSVFDNGQGIVPEALEKIFVPFFSTRKGGTGIGLSLSRQIMRLHRGDLSVSSKSDQMTQFSMRF